MLSPGKTNWKLMAEARGLHLSAADLALIVPLLDSLDAAFPPLASSLPHDIEPATILSIPALSPGAPTQE